MEFICDRSILSQEPGKRRLVHLSMPCYDVDNLPWGGEPLLCDGKIVGMTTSAAYGFQGNKPVSIATVELPNDDIRYEGFELEIACRTYPVNVRSVNLQT